MNKDISKLVLINRQLCLTQHVGTKDVLFGGQMLAWADIAASIWCMQIAQSDNMITVHMSDINFLAAVRVGEIVEFYGEGYNVGSTSVTVRIRVLIHDPRTDQKTEAFQFTTVMVNIDRNLKPRSLPDSIRGKTWNID